MGDFTAALSPNLEESSLMQRKHSVSWLFILLLLVCGATRGQTNQAGSARLVRAEEVAELGGQTNQTGGTLQGTVTLGDSGQPVHGVVVTILQLGRSDVTDDAGKYEFQNVPPGRYDVTAHLQRAPDVLHSVAVAASGATTQDFQLQ